MKIGEYGSGFGDFVAGGPLPLQIHVSFDLVLDFFACQEHGSVVFVAHAPAYFRGGHFGMLSCEVHTEVPGQGYEFIFLG